eukprot:scaffold923_cov256-Pinguiococcus_pyrenoidosus.AAC.39
MHAVETNEIFLLAAAVACHCWSTFAKNPGAERGAYARFVQEKWWECAVAETESEAAELRDVLLALTEEAVHFMREAGADFLRRVRDAELCSDNETLAGIFDVDTWGRTIGMFEQNNLGIRATHPGYDALEALYDLAWAGDGEVAGQNADEILEAESRAAALEYLQRLAPLLHQAKRDLEEAAQQEDEELDEDEDKFEGSIEIQHLDNDKFEFSKLMATEVRMEDAEEMPNEATEMPNEAEELPDDGEEMPDHSEEFTKAMVRAVLDDASRELERQEGMTLVEVEQAVAATSLLPPLDGTALFSVICMMNHSCTPNVKVVYCYREGATINGSEPEFGPATGVAGKQLVAAAIALDDIAADAELSISYIDSELPLDERQAMLRDYGFSCRCDKCTGEQEVEAGTSEEVFD